MPTTILIADDHDIIREGIKNILRGQGDFEIVGEAQNGEEVVEKVRVLKPDIVLLDITMPKKSGLDVLGDIRRLLPQAKILILSVHKTDAYVMRALKSGVSGYLNKENAADDLLPALRKIVSGKVYLGAEISSYLLERTHQGPEALAKEHLLTGREEDVLRCVVEGKTAKEIAESLSLSVRTVENYKNNLLKKLNLRRTSDLIKYAIKNKIVDIDAM